MPKESVLLRLEENGSTDKNNGAEIMNNQNDKGCDICKNGWYAGKPPLEIGQNDERWATLHLCEVCGTYWEAHLRNAVIISKDDAMKYYPATFANKVVDGSHQ